MLSNIGADSRYNTGTQPSSYFHNPDIVYSAQPNAQLSNYNQNYNPLIRGTCSKSAPFLSPKTREMELKKTLVVDLDETLVHASFKLVPCSDVVIPLKKQTIYVLFRPGAKEFLTKMAKIYEIVIFTASVEAYAKPLMEVLDPSKVCTKLLCREYCSQQGAMYVKDMSKLGRNLEDIILLDNSPNSYYYQQENGMPITNWYDDPRDKELDNYIEILEALAFVPDVRKYIPKMCANEQLDYSKMRYVLKEIYAESKSIDVSSNQSYLIQSPRNLLCDQLIKTPKKISVDAIEPLARTDSYSTNIKDYNSQTPVVKRQNKTPSQSKISLSNGLNLSYSSYSTIEFIL